MARATPEQIEKAKKRQAAIKAYADLVFPQTLATMINISKGALTSTTDGEQQRALRKQIARTAADIAITAGSEFLNKWSERKGEFIPE